ncbi:hypothetical protein CF326_g5709 [Tilletia indica]|nr:hypothetical protein CF326_g5709 [Tilletia indica]
MANYSDYSLLRACGPSLSFHQIAATTRQRSRGDGTDARVSPLNTNGSRFLDKQAGAERGYDYELTNARAGVELYGIQFWIRRTSHATRSSSRSGIKFDITPSARRDYGDYRL